TVIVSERTLLVSLLSAMRPRSSTLARVTCDPAVAVQVALATPALAVRMTEASGGIDAVNRSDHTMFVAPSTENATSVATAFGVGPLPLFFIWALNITRLPARVLA